MLNLVLTCRDLREGAGGGLPRATGDLAAALAAQGHGVRLLTDRSPAPLPDLPGVEVTELTVRRGTGRFADPAPDSAEFNLAYAAAVYREVRRTHAGQPVDAVLAPLWRSEGALCVLDERIPTAVSCMTSLHTVTAIDRDFEVDAARLALERAALRRARYLHGLTDSVLHQTVEDFGLAPEEVAVVPRGLRDRCAGRPSLAGDDARPLEVVFVGRLEHRKGVDVLLRAGAILAAGDAPVQLTLVGARGDGEAERLLAELGRREPRLRQMVTVLGAVPDDRLDDLLYRAGAVCLPSRYESHGVVVLEAFMFGRPVVSTGAGGLGEVIEDGRTALTVLPDDPGALADALLRLAREPALRRSLGAAARSAFEERFEVGAVAAQMARFLGGLPAATGGAAAGTASLAELVEEALGMPGPEAAAVAAELLADEDPVAAATRRRLAGAPSARRSADLSTVSVAILTRNRSEHLERTLDSVVTDGRPAEVLVLDDASEPGESRRVAELCAGRDGVRLERLEERLGCAGGRMAAAQRTRGELLLFLDDDCELLPGALAAMIDELDTNPHTGAVSATVCLPDGTVSHSGGRLEIRDAVAQFTLIGDGVPWAPEALPPSGPADWLGWTAVLVRRELLDAFPLDSAMRAYFEDNEWGYRVSRARPGALRRSREALAVHHVGVRHPLESWLPGRRQAVELLGAASHFLGEHGLLLSPGVFQAAPGLAGDEVSARVLLELVDRMGPDWILDNWVQGGLDGFLGVAALHGHYERLTIELGDARDAATERLEDLAELQRRHEELCEANAVLHRDHAVVLARERRLLEALAAQDEALGMLAQRAETLARIEQGGWWRLRSRLLPVLRLALRLRSGPARPARAERPAAPVARRSRPG